MSADPRSLIGLMARGKNMYIGGNAAENAGRPRKPRIVSGQEPLLFDVDTIQRRLNGFS